VVANPSRGVVRESAMERRGEGAKRRSGEGAKGRKCDEKRRKRDGAKGLEAQ